MHRHNAANQDAHASCPALLHGHAHQHCIEDALDKARQLCRERGTQLTPQREQVLTLLWSGHKPRGAYDILADMTAGGRKVAPLTVYRALDFLLEQGLIHRIESRNAFIGCPDPQRPHAGQFFVCQGCGDAAELDDPGISAAIQAAGAAGGFAITRQMVEVAGLCPACQASGPEPSPTPT
jgi:Fur family transcriptional regulator, zinc uptake regulator